MRAINPRRLTVAQIEAIKPSETRSEISDGGSALRLVVFPSGVKSWVVRFRSNGRTRKLTLGRYPSICLKDARLLANETMIKIARGDDPAREKQETAKAKKETIEMLVPLYIEKWQLPRNRTWAEVESCLNRVLVKPLGKKSIHTIRRRDLICTLDGRNRRTLANVKRFFAWCCEQDIIQTSPATAIRCADPIVHRDRVLDDVELRAFFLALGELGSPWAEILELLILTGQRRGEVAEADWSEFDFERHVWTIPKARAKNGRAHSVPLSDRAWKLVSALPSRGNAGFLFPADHDGVGAASGFSKVKRRLDTIMSEQLSGSDELKSWRIHDLRRTAATGMARLGTAPHIVEAVLNHSTGTVSGVAAIYNRFDYADEKRSALERWARSLHELRS
ncbi:MAG: integrase arm-type DNA-binding domain-containing protein [Pseudomonadota bacterium]